MPHSGVRIAIDDPSGTDVAVLLAAHLGDMRATSPPESVHALDIDELRDPSVTVWSVREGAELLAIGALKELDPTHGEIKSMRTADAHRGRGIASRLVEHLIAEARRRGMARLSLETGSQPFFAPARALYARQGFTRCPPFADYTDDPHSVYLTLRLRPE